MDHSVILFDGHCNLCNKWVKRVIRYDSKKLFKFAALQNETVLDSVGFKKYNLNSNIKSVVLINKSGIHYRSTAVLKILKDLDGLWPIAYYLFIWIPPILRNAVYNLISNRRYTWFGKRNTCMAPSPEEADRFL
jgi:predicted DCC family thiol-disulfide oxidoreductase YuxK